MSGLIDTGTGLAYGHGLSFEAGLGGPGLDNPPPSAQITFSGAGNLSVTGRVQLVARATFNGAGGLRE